METGCVWKDFFQKWPKDVTPRGVAVTVYEDQILFEGFALSETMVMLERKTPDTSGARKVFLPYDKLHAVKIIDVLRSRVFQPMGFDTRLVKD